MSNPKLEISIGELRDISNRLFDHLESSQGKKVELQRDYYWSLKPEHLYDVYTEPREFSVGSVSEDVNNLKAVSSGQRPPLTFHLVYLASLLRTIGYSHDG